MNRRISVWAPSAKAVDLIAAEQTCAMEESGQGWYGCNTELAAGDDYAFSVDGGESDAGSAVAVAAGRRPWPVTPGRLFRESAIARIGGAFSDPGTQSSMSCMWAHSHLAGRSRAPSQSLIT